MEIKVLKDEKDYLVISKPAGISVHEGAGEKQFTIVDWLFEKYPLVKSRPWISKTRPGIVHRLDKDTSGILILAKNQEALDFFQSQFRNREVEKHYTTLVFGKPPFESGSIDAQIHRDPKDRKKQKVDLINFDLDQIERKFSSTDYKTIESFSLKGQPLTLLDVKINTGRKHQIRVHMKYEGCPVMGDQTYCSKGSKRLSKVLGLDRQFLHASSLKFKDLDGKVVEIKDELPGDLNKLSEK